MKGHVVSRGIETNGSRAAAELDNRIPKIEEGCAPWVSPKGDSATPLKDVPHLKGRQSETEHCPKKARSGTPHLTDTGLMR